jgi:pilus assembly protein Flp/PilA
MLKVIKRIREDEEGASAVEYGLLVAAIAAIVILLVFAIGGWVKGAFQDTCEGFEKAGDAGAITNAGQIKDCEGGTGEEPT